MKENRAKKAENILKMTFNKADTQYGLIYPTIFRKVLIRAIQG